MALLDEHFRWGRKVVASNSAQKFFWKPTGAIERARRLYVEDDREDRSLMVYAETLYAAIADAEEKAEGRRIIGAFILWRRRSAINALRDLAGHMESVLDKGDTGAETYEAIGRWFTLLSRPRFGVHEAERTRYRLAARISIERGAGAAKRAEAGE